MWAIFRIVLLLMTLTSNHCHGCCISGICLDSRHASVLMGGRDAELLAYMHMVNIEPLSLDSLFEGLSDACIASSVLAK